MNESYGRFTHTNIVFELAQFLQQSGSAAIVYFSSYKHTEEHEVRFSVS